jgi:hypothetical protein
VTPEETPDRSGSLFPAQQTPWIVIIISLYFFFVTWLRQSKIVIGKN